MRKLGEWYLQRKQAGIGDGVGRLGEWISANPTAAATVGGGALGGVVGAASDGADGWRGRVRRSLTGALAGGAAGAGTALAGKALLGPAKAPTAPGPQFTVGGQKMQFDPKAIAANPDLATELSSINEPSANQLINKGVDKVWSQANNIAPFTTMLGVPIAAGSKIYHEMTKVSPGAGKGPVADAMGSTRNWTTDTTTANNALRAEASKGLPKGTYPPPATAEAIRKRTVENMIGGMGAKKVNPTDATQHFSFRPNVWDKKKPIQSLFSGIKNPSMKIKPNRAFGGKTMLALGALPVLDALRAAWKGDSEDNAKTQKLLELVRQHAKPVQG